MSFKHWSASRRAFSLSAIACALSAFAQSPVTVLTDKGPVVGVPTADVKVVAFKGVPFAAPPVGGLRWQPPQPALAWAKPLDASTFGHRCLQTETYNDMSFHDSGAAEDCLNLNVWTTATPHAKLPVMVWIYGGGFVAGGTSEGRQDGQFLAHRNVIVVSMNYRMGIFGFLALPGLSAESPHHASGNYGLMDQVAALAWVQRNIARFGGDPHNVTLFGESAGSAAVSTLMASPLAKGLFQRAIGESGGAFRNGGGGYQTLSEHEARDAATMQHTFGTADVSELRKRPADDILRAVISPIALPGAVGGRPSATREPAPRFGPGVDGYFLPEPVEAIYAAGKQAHIPLLAGWNADEGRPASSAKAPLTAASFQAQAVQEYGEKASAFLALYPATDDAKAFRSASDYAGDQFIAFSTWRWLQAQAQTGGAPVYHYVFVLGSPGDPNHTREQGAFHSDEIEYVFGAQDSRVGAIWRPEDRSLSEQMMAYWTNFARSGDPNGAGLPTWPVYAGSQWMTMQLNVPSEAAPDPHQARYLFLKDNLSPAPRP